MLRFGLALGLLLLSWGCTTAGESPEPPASAGTLALTPCRIEGLRDEAKCGELEVFEDRQANEGRKITLHFAVVPALAVSPQPDPLFLMMGGPGQSALKSGPGVVHAFEEVRRHRDIVLLDQRGTGRSHPLPCQGDNEKPLSEVFRADFDLQFVKSCVKALDADPRHYTTATAMDDLDDVRKALGYSHINLWGGSYGTRAALIYSRRHPEAVRRMILDGVAPLEIKLPLNSGDDAQRSLDLLSERCRQRPACKALVPDVSEAVRAIIARLSVQPQKVQLSHPRTGEKQVFTLTASAFAAGLRAPLYVPALTALIPMALAAIEHGDYQPYVTLVLTVSDGIASDLQFGMMLSVLCAEDMTQVDEAAIEKYSQNFLGRAALDSLRQTCEVWPHAIPPPSYFSPMTSAAPTLVLSGVLDPVTPPRWGQLVTDTLKQAQHVVVSGLAHGVSTVSCVPHAIAEFLSSDSPMEVNVVCAKKLNPPPIFVNRMGSQP